MIVSKLPGMHALQSMHSEGFHSMPGIVCILAALESILLCAVL